MNPQTASRSPTFASNDWLTTFNLALIAAFAVIVVIAILYGMRLRARRRDAEHQEAARVDEEGAGTSQLSRSDADPKIAPSPAPAPVAPAPPPLADQPVVATPAPAVETGGGGPVTQLKGLGPKVAAQLAEVGITDVGQLAALSPDEADALDARMGPFRGRMARDRWIEQARFLAAGDTKGFEAVFGRL